MTTAALLPTPGDPFIARYWARNYERVWRGEADELVVLVNGHEPREAVRIFASVGARVTSYDRRLGHGEALRELVGMTDADTLVLVEDDAYVREPGAIRSRLERAADGEIIGSPRGGMHPALERAARDRWGEVTGPDGSTGHGLWPCFLFTRREFLTATDMGFGSRFWGPGETIPGLAYTVGPDALDTDTMTAIAFQLRAEHPISLEGQWKEVHQKDFAVASKAGPVPYFHAGGLSTLHEPIPAGLSGSNAGRDFAHRLWWWERTAPWDDYRLRAVDVKTKRAGLQADLRAWDDVIPPWINWSDGWDDDGAIHGVGLR